MGMSRAQKEQEVLDLKDRFENDQTLVIVHNKGLTVAEMTDFRSALRAEGACFKVSKNTLAKRALEGTKVAGMADMFSGPTGIASSEDVVAAARIVHKFAKSNENLVIVGGAMGAEILDVKGVQQLAKMLSLDELRGKLVGLIQAPATKIAGVLQAPAGQLARVCGAYGAKG